MSLGDFRCVEAGGFPVQLACRIHRKATGNDQGTALFGAFPVKRCHTINAAVTLFQPGMHGPHNQPIGQRLGANLDGGKNMGIGFSHCGS